jgi:hypothetical protein
MPQAAGKKRKTSLKTPVPNAPIFKKNQNHHYRCSYAPQQMRPQQQKSRQESETRSQ